MIGPWLETQPERVQAALEPSWSPVRAAVVLAARHEQEAIASLDGFFSKLVTRFVRLRDELLKESRLLPTESDSALIYQVVNLVRVYRVWAWKTKTQEFLNLDTGEMGKLLSDEERAYARITQLEEQLIQLETELATARAAMGPLVDPPLPQPCEIVTVGVDPMVHGLFFEVVRWNTSPERVEFGSVNGSPSLDSTWDALKAKIDCYFPHAVVVCSSFHTDRAREFRRSFGSRCILVHGVGSNPAEGTEADCRIYARIGAERFRESLVTKKPLQNDPRLP